MQQLSGDLISVIVPVYNVAEYLDQCVESLVRQTYPHLEIILVDDGSTDRSGEICDRWAEKDKRISVKHKENGGLSDARNAGLSVARGRYIGFVDSDDWVAEDLFEQLLRACNGENAIIVACGYKRVYRDGVENYVLPDAVSLSREEALTTLFKGESFGVQAWAKLYSAELFEGITYPVGRLFEDSFTTYKLFLKANRIVTVGGSLYFYRQRKSGITLTGFNEKKLDMIYANDSVRQDPRIAENELWQRLLQVRQTDATCWSLIDLYLVSDHRPRIGEIERRLFNSLKKDRFIALRKTRSRSSKLLLLVSFFGQRVTRTIFSSGMMRNRINSQHQYFS